MLFCSFSSPSFNFPRNRIFFLYLLSYSPFLGRLISSLDLSVCMDHVHAAWRTATSPCNSVANRLSQLLSDSVFFFFFFFSSHRTENLRGSGWGQNVSISGMSVLASLWFSCSFPFDSRMAATAPGITSAFREGRKERGASSHIWLSLYQKRKNSQTHPTNFLCLIGQNCITWYNSL